VKYLIPERDANKRKKHYLNMVCILLFSLALPFLMGLVQSALDKVSLSITFAEFYKYFILSGILFFVLYTMECYMHVRRVDMMDSRKQLFVIMLIIAITYIFAMIFGAFISVYTMPLVMAGLLIGMLIEKRLALFGSVLINLAFFLIYITIVPNSNTIDVMSAILTSSISACLFVVLMRRSYTRMSFLIIGTVIAVCASIPLAMLCTLINFTTVSDVFVNAIWAVVSIILSVAFFMILLPLFESIFQLYSNFRLEEICSADFPMLKRLSEEAPGTYNHSLVVGNLAQACAIKIGENPALAKACAYYHDLGKLKNPICFTENQNGYNPHDDYIPEVSIKMITDHAEKGYQLLKKNKFPDIIANVAREHHGTTAVKYFYYKVKNITDEKLEQQEFCYPGPKPQTKIAAIIMITDTIEAATRAEGIDPDIKVFREFLHGLIQEKVNAQQFNECPLTLKDLQDIENKLLEIVPNMYHHRIKYTK
jgi:putative nucleotidyltransferase with HDIG domain